MTEKLNCERYKENQYIDFWIYLAKLKVCSEKDKAECQMELSAKIQTIYLVGSIRVQNALDKFLSVFINSDKNINQNEAHARLIAEMKKDLYPIRQRKSRDAISFTVFSG